MKTCVFVGPSSGDVALPADVDRYAPAALGAVWRAVEQGYERIALVDGLFGMVPAVWHKEILHALAHGVQVYGASSMGALRAAELAPYGMVGVGSIFRFYRAGRLTDDDEVCLLHAPIEFDFKPLTLPMVSIRRTLAAMARAGELERGPAESACQAMKRRHFSQRTWEALHPVFSDATPRPVVAVANFERRYVDLKTCDYQALLNVLKGTAPPAEPLSWQDFETHKWRAQFIDQSDDIPPLQPW